MKTKIALAAIAVSLIIGFISCDWFGSDRKKETEQAFNIEGEWLIDSVENKSADSSKNMGIFLLALAAKDSLPLGIAFNTDSTYHFINAKDSIKGNYYLSEDEKSLFVKEDSAFYQLNFISKTDSSFIASSADSLVYHLRRK